VRALIHARAPDLWVHGHVHRAADYLAGRTRIVCNPRGHADKGSGFDPAKVVSIEPPSAST